MVKNARFLAISMVLLSIPALADTPAGPAISGDQALQKLLEGNARFVEGKMKNVARGHEKNEALRQSQKPFGIILACSDSRVPPEIIFDQERGDLFVVRVAGNTLDDLALGSIEYGAVVLGSPLIMVLGHENCGAVKAVLEGKPLPGHIQDVVKLIQPALTPKPTCEAVPPLDCSIRANAHWLSDRLKSSEPLLAPLIKSGKLKVVSAFYDFDSGKVEILP